MVMNLQKTVIISQIFDINIAVNKYLCYNPRANNQEKGVLYICSEISAK